MFPKDGSLLMIKNHEYLVPVHAVVVDSSLSSQIHLTTKFPLNSRGWSGATLLVGYAVSIFYIYTISLPNLLISPLMTAKTNSKRMLLSGNTTQGKIAQSLHDSSSQQDASHFFRLEKSSDYTAKYRFESLAAEWESNTF